jgi:hypothetical protein
MVHTSTRENMNEANETQSWAGWIGFYDYQRHIKRHVVIPVKKGKKLKLSLCLTKHQAMKAYWGVEL